MECGACAKTVERAVAALDGITSAEVSFGNGTMAVAGDASDAAITSAVARAGCRAHVAVRRELADAVPYWRRDARALSTTLSVGLLAIAVIAALASAPRAVAEPLYLLSMVVGGWPIARAAGLALHRRRPDMNVLMALAAAPRNRRRPRALGRRPATDARAARQAPGRGRSAARRRTHDDRARRGRPAVGAVRPR
jgi:Cd2+/Zn2+-exporting ATPase